MKAKIKRQVEVKTIAVSKKFDRLEDMLKSMYHKQGQGYIVKPCITKDNKYCYQYAIKIV